MNLDVLWAEIEAEQEWREAELHFLHNQLESLDDGEQQNKFRRILVVMLYAHLEGFCKFAFRHYLRAVNLAKIKCSEATFAIAASSLSNIFTALRNPTKKCDEFRKELPDDRKLHRFARDREFIESTANFEAQVVAIPDNVVDFESSLNPAMLRKSLYRLGLPHDQFSELDGEIKKLLEYRNGIAHGSHRGGISHEKYDPLYQAVFKIMAKVKRDIMSALTQGKYRRAS